MVCPEVDHYFLQLPLTVNRAEDAGHLQFARYELWRTQIVLFEIFIHRAPILWIIHRISIVRVRIRILRVWIRGVRWTLHLAIRPVRSLWLVWTGALTALNPIVARGGELRGKLAAPLKLLQQLPGLRIPLIELRCRHPQRFKILKPRFARRVINLVGIQLKVDVLIK